ncbi:MAG: hypothetical protein ABIQ95_00910 [Bdellovibrionia bacterium]
MNYKPLIIIAGFFLSVIVSPFSYSSEKVDLDQEIEITDLKLQDGTLNESSLDFYTKYSAVLHQTLSGEPGIGLQKYPHQLGLKKIHRIKAAIKNLPDWAGGKVSAQEIYHFLNFIEENKKQLKVKAPAVLNYHLPLLINGESKTRRVTLISPISPKPSIFLDFNKKIEQQGSGKSFKKAVQYKNFSPVAELISHNRPSSIESLQNEVELLTLLDSLPATEKLGLVDLLGHLPDRFFQSLADKDLFYFFESGIGTQAQRIDIIHQLARGLVALHKLGISHNDIKLENVLLRDEKPRQRFNSQRYVAMYNDLGMSTRPRLDLRKGESRFEGGTSYTMAPEITKGWIGINLEEKIENFLKADVFSQGILAFYLLKPFNLVEGLLNCSEEKLNFDGKLECRTKALAEITEKFLQNQDYDSLDQLLIRALESNPKDRISAVQFSLGMDHIKTKAARSRFIGENTLEDLNLHLKGFTHYTIASEIPHEPGEYFLKPTKVKGRFLLTLHFMDRNHKQRKQILDIDPLTPDFLVDEIKFLQEIGTLKKP